MIHPNRTFHVCVLCSHTPDAKTLKYAFGRWNVVCFCGTSGQYAKTDEGAIEN